MIKNKVELIQLASYIRPEVKETASKEWVLYGQNNDFYDVIIDGYNNSPTNAAIIDSYSQMTYGLGLNIEQTIISKNDLRNATKDFVMFNECAFEVVYQKKKVVAMYHVPKQKIAPEKHTDGEIKGYFFCEDWQNTSKNIPQRFDAFGFGDKTQNEIVVFKDYQVGKFYYSDPTYLSAIPYIQLEQELANYYINHVKNGLSAGFIINMNGGMPSSEEQKDQIARAIKGQLTGSGNAGKFVLSFNENKDTATTIEPIEISDAHSQYQFLTEEAQNKICVAHKVVSRAILGINDASGFSSNADEIETAFNETLLNVIQPKQEIILDGIERVTGLTGLEFIQLRVSQMNEAQSGQDVAQPQDVQTPQATTDSASAADLIKKEASYNGAQIASSLDIMTAVKDGILTQDQAITFLIQMLQFEPEVAKALFVGNAAQEIAMAKESQKKKNSVKQKHETDGIADALIELGEEIDEAEWEEIDAIPLKGNPSDIEMRLNLSMHIEMARDFASFWKDKSSQDTSLFKVRYKYKGGFNAERDFCQKMVNANKVYRKEDIQLASTKVVNAGFGPRGADTYNLFLYKGGVNCRHYWERVIYLKKNNEKISVNEARKRILALDPEERDAARWEQNDPRVAQIASPQNNFWKLD